ncbi:MAG: hypothetical protein IJ672_10440 [Methanobrevibacter sp.]|uniref:hypothetical protein n=1 Tax=Methanobrevibacter sp. TaxID=66852 RepID=UPI0025D00AEE|nr:hypothetical protein [Methanobrevibacter sp.]MBQ8017571.1 hypothetical protein [Methanobrevibacter sp.]MBR1611876.1 hypothetical protein [Methanobrevibacter sp.]
MTPSHENIPCIQQEKITSLEKEIIDLKAENAELSARVDGKKDDIYSINKELIRDRETQIKLLTEVTELKTLLKKSQEDREANDNEIKDLKDEISALKLGFTDFKSSVNSFRNTMLTIFGVGTPIVTLVVTVILKFWGL